jgi:hypothetical protein
MVSKNLALLTTKDDLRLGNDPSKVDCNDQSVGYKLGSRLFFFDVMIEVWAK